MLLSGFENVGIVDFRRDFAFDREFRLLIVPRMLGIVSAIGFALMFVNYWALIIGILTTRISRVGMTYAMHPYRPRFGLAAWRAITGFSVWSWVISIADLLRERSDSLVIGRLLNTTEVGVYAIGMEIASLPTTELVEPLGRACFSGFSAARHAGGLSLSDTYLRVIAITALLTVPAGFGISLVADPVIKLAFGARWAEAVPLVRILAIGGVFTLFGTISSVLFSAHAMMSVNFRIAVAALLLRFALLVALATQFGLPGAAVAAAASIAFEQSLYVVAILRRFGLRARDLLRHTWRCLIATASMTATMLACGFGWHTASGSALALAADLGVACGIGAGAYAASLLVLWVLAGRPRGAEADLLEALRRGLGEAARLVRGRKLAAGRGVPG